MTNSTPEPTGAPEAPAQTFPRISSFTRRGVLKSMVVTGGAVAFAGFGKAPKIAAQDVTLKPVVPPVR